MSAEPVASVTEGNSETALGKLTARPAAIPIKKSDGIVSDLDLESRLSGLSAIHPWIEAVASDRAQDELVSLGIPGESDFFDHANTRAADYAKDRSAELVSQIDESTRDMLRRKIAAGLASGAMREEIIDSIMDLSDLFDEARATKIADYEVGAATGAGAQAGREEAIKAGVKLEKAWVCDSEPCPLCEENQDASPIPNDSEFPSGDMAEIAHNSCRCHTESVVEDDKEESNDEE